MNHMPIQSIVLTCDMFTSQIVISLITHARYSGFVHGTKVFVHWDWSFHSRGCITTWKYSKIVKCCLLASFTSALPICCEILACAQIWSLCIPRPLAYKWVAHAILQELAKVWWLYFQGANKAYDLDAISIVSLGACQPKIPRDALAHPQMSCNSL